MFYENKYQIGDQVKSTLDEIETGEIECIIEQSTNDTVRYSYWVYNRNNTRYFKESENFLKPVKQISPKDDSDSVKRLRQITESSDYQSDLKVGDVVKFRNGLMGEYVVSTIIETAHGEELWHYELIPTIKKDPSMNETYVCGRLLLEFQYHDATWEKELLTESYRQHTLPAWRGELYNFYICYVDIDAHGNLDQATVGEYKNHTIPPKRMEHILRSHSIYDRIWDVVLNDGNSRWSSNRDQIRRNLKIDNDELDTIAYTIRRKIDARNKNDLNPENLKKADRRNPDFTDKEYQFIDEIDKLDLSKGKIKDHFPILMTNLQIMDAIKEVYTSKELERISGRQICDSKKEGTDEDLDAPKLGKTHYRGHSDKYGIDIEFIYNFDYNFIETAYPLRMNKKPERHLRDRLDKR